ncbi:stage III sporulation protein AA [Irregularibacter muris]|uniref:Stage III sporulation protein AA n=1 Tax=Irregularibacter muris TaxID=1796619 RepID=A0AAE3HCM2_9FIRM|nr:stage III sporulation protein AA [Irregularibacter muris]MCR1897987.1 stage III sporulation protein AA [Irregularibacter muris]
MSLEKNKRKNKTLVSIYHDILPSLSHEIRECIEEIEVNYLEKIEEIRIRENRPLMISFNNKDYFVTKEGTLTNHPQRGYLVTRKDRESILQLISDYSLYAIEEELKHGFLTLRGGHRVGLTGKTVLENGHIKTIKYISGFNFRISREIKGAGDKVMPYIREKTGILHTLIISPPQCGKTTLLRDIIRQLSDGDQRRGIPGVKVGVVDERSELAGCYQGVPQNDIGIRTDVLDACPKAQGMIMLIRSMSPDIIATDEIGCKEDMAAIEEALNAGIKIITTVHGKTLEEIKRKPFLKELIHQKIFQRIIILSNAKGVGTIENIVDGSTFKELLMK